jgi:hypothetical protein
VASEAGYCLLLGFVVAAEFTAWSDVFGGISIQTQFFLFSTIFPAGALQFVLFDRRKEAVSVLKPYIVGTLGMVLSDLARTFSGALDVLPQIVGANGPLDGVFLVGLYVVMAYLVTAFVYLRFWVLWRAWKAL